MLGSSPPTARLGASPPALFDEMVSITSAVVIPPSFVEIAAALAADDAAATRSGSNVTLGASPPAPASAASLLRLQTPLSALAPRGPLRMFHAADVSSGTVTTSTSLAAGGAAPLDSLVPPLPADAPTAAESPRRANPRSAPERFLIDTAHEDALPIHSLLMPDASTGWSRTLLFVFLVHLASGCGYTLSVVWQNHLILKTSYAKIGSPTRVFAHPFIQTYFILLGQAINLPIALSLRWMKWAASAQQRQHQLRESSATPGAIPLQLRPSGLLSQTPSADASSSPGGRRDPPAADPAFLRQRLRLVCTVLVVTSLMETTETTLCVYSLTLMDASVFSMLRISQLVFATSLQLFVLPHVSSVIAPSLRRCAQRIVGCCSASIAEPSSGGSAPAFGNVYFSRSQKCGLLAVVVGVFIVYLSAQRELSDSHLPSVQKSVLDEGVPVHNSLSTAIGCALVLTAMIILSVQMAIHEYILRNYSDVIEPMELIGFQGLGCTVFAMASIALVNSSIIGMHDSVSEFFIQLSDGWMAPVSLVAMVLCTTVVDFTGTYLTKFMSANVRPALQPMRSAIIWIAGLATQTSTFSFARLIGFVMSAVGAMIFKRMIAIPKWLTFADEDRRPEG